MKKLLAAVGVAAAVVLGSLAGAGTASATGSETAYLNALNLSGYEIYNPQAALNTGYWICSEFQYADGNQISRELFYSTSWSDVPSLAAAQAWVNTAANTLCPEVWENGSIPSRYLS